MYGPNVTTAYNEFLRAGYTPAVASALVGNLLQESGVTKNGVYDLNTSAVGDNGNSIGMGQWNGPRARSLEAFAKERGLDINSAATQAQFLVHELNTSESKARDSILAGGNDPANIAVIASQKFWRPGTPMEENRRRNAMNFYRYINDGALTTNNYSMNIESPADTPWMGTDMVPPVEVSPTPALAAPPPADAALSAITAAVNGVDPPKPYPNPQIGLNDPPVVPSGPAPVGPANTPIVMGPDGLPVPPWPAESTTPVLDQSNVAPAAPVPAVAPSFMDQVKSYLGDAQNQDELLAIGAGLLSGKNWAEGGALAAQGVLNVRKDFRDNELRKSLTGGGERFQKVPNLQLEDGSVIGDAVFDKVTGQYFRPGADGQFTPVTGFVQKNASQLTQGAPTAEQLRKIEQALTSNNIALNSYDRVMKSMETVEFGAKGQLIDWKGFYDTILGRGKEQGLDEAYIQRAVAKGDIQSLIGLAREATVGPGPMTEQDALRVIAALGGDLSLLTNPEIVKRMLGQARENTLKIYNTDKQRYETTRDRYPDIPHPYNQWYGDSPSDLEPVLKKYE